LNNKVNYAIILVFINVNEKFFEIKAEKYMRGGKSGMIKEELNGSVIYRGMDAYDIQKFQQNRYPLLFIDFVKEAVAGKSAVGHKNFSYNEWFFPAHFEDEPNVPGFVQMEAMTQMFIMTFLTIPGNEGLKTAFVKNETEFKLKIIPGDRLDIESCLESYSRGVARGYSVGMVDGKLACKEKFIIAVPDVIKKYSPKNVKMEH
jgi:3-hydroxyacyl-[acyl-carrier-protein] dehydratase